MRKISYFKLLLLLIFPAVLAWGCTYMLRYKVSASLSPQTSADVAERTFHMEADGGAEQEAEIFDIVEETLTMMGWTVTPEGEASYRVTVDTVTEQHKRWEERLFDWVLIGIGPSTDGKPIGRRENYQIHNIEIGVFSNQGIQRSKWTCNIRTKPVAQDLVTLGRHIIPTALGYFPEEGSWELQQNVYLHSEKTAVR